MNMAIPSNPSNYNYKTSLVQQSPTSSVPVSPPLQTTPSLQKVKNATPKKDNKKPWLLWGSALVGAALVGTSVFLVRDHQAKLSTTKQIPELLESIFGKQYSPKEAELALKKYQSLLQIKDKEAFITKAFHEVKKDFGLEDVELKLDMTDKGFFNRNGGNASIFKGEVSIDKGWDKLDSPGRQAALLKDIAHELKHIEQASLIERAGLWEEWHLEDLIKKNPELENNSELLKFAKKQIEKSRASSPYRHLPRIPKDSPEYERACQLYKAWTGYTSHEISKKAYRKNLLEVEAFHSGDEMERLIHKIQQSTAKP
jgi:hypothetical protein